MSTTIFWPYDVKHSGFCYGWKTPSICVAGVLKTEDEQEAQSALQALHHSIHWRFLSVSCGGEPQLLGICVYARNGDSHTSFPIIRFESCTGDYTLIQYHRHQSNTLRFYTLNVPHQTVAQASAYLPSAQHDFTAPKSKYLNSSINDMVINQFNSAKTLEQVILSESTLTEDPKVIKHLSFVGSFILRLSTSLSVALSNFCNLPILPSASFPFLKDVSATVQQLDVRAEQMGFFSAEVESLRCRTSTPIYVYSKRYTNFFNAVWLILNDITMGVALGSFICENYLILTEILVKNSEGFIIQWVQQALRWLDSWPAGLKLNTELSRFYAYTFVDLVTLWGNIVRKGVPYFPTLIYAIGILSNGGMTVAISLLLDVLAILTAHIYVCYAISRGVYQRMLQTAGSLWNLFRGKRYNVLRNRTDSWEYDIDQLLFGTILFTLLAFLFPTVLAYYALFAVMRLSVLVVQASLETLLAFMNHFPLFALMLRVKDPSRLPGGIYFLSKPLPGFQNHLLIIQSQPVPLSVIFFQYIELLSQLAKHYNPLRLLHSLFTGRHLATIPRYSIRYNKIPVDSGGG